jgi:hypothetical protein
MNGFYYTAKMPPVKNQCVLSWGAERVRFVINQLKNAAVAVVECSLQWLR